MIGQWPAYRVSTTQVMTSAAPALRLLLADADAGAGDGPDVSVALIAYLTKNAAGGEIATPGLKR